jgi:hypothetical protein
MELLGTLLLDLFITAIAYLFVPLIIYISEKKLTLLQIKKVITINGICVSLIFVVIRAANGIDGASIGLLWWYIGYTLLKRKCSVEWDDTKIYEPNKTINFKNVAKGLAVLLAISVVFNIVQLSNTTDNTEVSEKLEFYDENIVFVIDGYGDYYYTYDQMVKVTKDDDYYEYWAYNKEQAIDLGYIAYPNKR